MIGPFKTPEQASEAIGAYVEAYHHRTPFGAGFTAHPKEVRKTWGRSPDPEEVVEEREAMAVGREALQMLRERDRLIFCRRYEMNLSPEVEAHLTHRRACRQSQAQMRGFLVDVAGGLLVASSLAGSSRDPAPGRGNRKPPTARISGRSNARRGKPRCARADS